MLKFSADYILAPDQKLIAGMMLVADDHGKIIDLVRGTDSETTHFDGIICPGFINTHCHLELSHLQNKIPKGTGLTGFISDIISVRSQYTTGIENAIILADEQMWQEGIQGVGDICNTHDTFSTKQKSQIRYHSFIELFNFKPSEAAAAFDSGLALLDEAVVSHHQASLVPHAPYSVTPNLFELIKEYHREHPASWSIHNQESEAENEIFVAGNGVLWNLFRSKGIDMSWFEQTGKNSLQSISEYFPPFSKLLFVHNTFITKNDIDFLASSPLFEKSWFCLCPKANLYIEKKLPPVSMLNDADCKLTIGTDSLASNNSLSILDELKTIHAGYKDIPVEKLLGWATANGAEYFNWKNMGAFTKNATPGIIGISKAGLNQIHPESEITRLA